jgi:hypothetical protein
MSENEKIKKPTPVEFSPEALDKRSSGGELYPIHKGDPVIVDPKSLGLKEDPSLSQQYLKERFHIEMKGLEYDAAHPPKNVIEKVQETLGLEKTGTLDKATLAAIEGDKKEASKHYDAINSSNLDIALPPQRYETHPKNVEQETHQHAAKQHKQARRMQADNQTHDPDLAAIRESLQGKIAYSEPKGDIHTMENKSFDLSALKVAIGASMQEHGGDAKGQSELPKVQPQGKEAASSRIL